jgi:transposase
MWRVIAFPPADDAAAVAELADVVIGILEERNRELGERNAELSEQVAGLAERLAAVERMLGRNSGNSGMAPSSDDIPGRTPPPPKPRRGAGKRRAGKQRGAPGAHLAWAGDPDERKPLFPEGPCGCGRDLADALDLGVAESRQVIDTPAASATITQYDGHRVQCRCGKVHVAVPPAGAGAPGTCSYGPNLQAWIVFLLVMHHVPVERCAGILEALTGARPSDGFVHGMIARAARAVRGANELIRALIVAAAVLCADETPVRVGPGPKTRKKYLLVACTNLLTCYFLGTRGKETFDAFVFPELDGTVLVHDRYQNYDAFPGVFHQLCTQHILRDLEDCAQQYPGAIWPGQAVGALRGLIHAANAARGQGLSAVPGWEDSDDLRLFRNAVLVGLQEIPRVPGANSKQKTGRCLLECLRNREQDVLRFLTDLRIPPTSNQAERDLRPAKTQQKISGRLRSDAVTADRYAIRGYLDTARKHGQNIIDVIREALDGNAWTPSVPA